MTANRTVYNGSITAIAIARRAVTVRINHADVMVGRSNAKAKAAKRKKNKCRNAYLIIIKAHHTLEKHTLTKWQLYWKEQLANWYGNLLHEGQYLDPVMRNIETFLGDTQQYVTGKAFVRLSPNHFRLNYQPCITLLNTRTAS